MGTWIIGQSQLQQHWHNMWPNPMRGCVMNFRRARMNVWVPTSEDHHNLAPACPGLRHVPREPSCPRLCWCTARRARCCIHCNACCPPELSQCVSWWLNKYLPKLDVKSTTLEAWHRRQGLPWGPLVWHWMAPPVLFRWTCWTPMAGAHWTWGDFWGQPVTLSCAEHHLSRQHALPSSLSRNQSSWHWWPTEWMCMNMRCQRLWSTKSSNDSGMIRQGRRRTWHPRGTWWRTVCRAASVCRFPEESPSNSGVTAREGYPHFLV